MSRGRSRDDEHHHHGSTASVDLEPEADESPPAHVSPAEISPDDYERAYERRAREIAAVSGAALVPISIDVPEATRTVRTALLAMAPYTDLMKKMPGFDAALHDGMSDYALAAYWTNSAYLRDGTHDDDLPALQKEGAALRERLYDDLTILANRGYLTASQFANVSHGSSYQTLSVDLISLRSVFRLVWKRVQGKMAVTTEELDRAEQIATALDQRLIARREGPAASKLTRQQAFSLMAASYEQARAALTWLRRLQGDAEQIAPSIYAGRGRRKASSDAPAAPEPHGDDASTPAPPDVVSVPSAATSLPSVPNPPPSARLPGASKQGGTGTAAEPGTAS